MNKHILHTRKRQFLWAFITAYELVNYVFMTRVFIGVKKLDTNGFKFSAKPSLIPITFSSMYLPILFRRSSSS